MEKSLIAAFKSMLTMHRWNLHPRVETWVEAENAALRAHWAYAVIKGEDDNSSVSKKDIIHLMFRVLLKPLNKHYMTDISVFVTNKLKPKAEWKSVVDDYAADTAKLFPREISGVIQRYLCYEGDYIGGWGSKKWGVMNGGISSDTNAKIDAIINFSKFKVQEQECKINRSVYNDEYESILGEISTEITKVRESEKYTAIINDKRVYFDTIAHLKYLRRWNTVNRFVPSSVLGHTYIVAILTLMFSLSEPDKKDNIDFIHEALLRALFHDVPEAVTGDIATPVKDKFIEAMAKKEPKEGEKEQKEENKEEDIITKIEKELIADFIKDAPGTVGKVIGAENGGLNLLDKLNNSDVGGCVSLVKDCDRLALMLECLYEKEAKVIDPEMEETYHECYRELNNSEWPSARRFLSVLSDHWRLND